MDEKIEEMAKIIKPIVVSSYLVDRENDEVKQKAIEEVKKQQTRNATALYNAGYRKESDTAREILTLIKNGVELNSMIDGYAKIAIMNELRWAGQKYGIDFTNS